MIVAAFLANEYTLSVRYSTHIKSNRVKSFESRWSWISHKAPYKPFYGYSKGTCSLFRWAPLLHVKEERAQVRSWLT